MNVDTFMPPVIPLPAGFGLSIDLLTGEAQEMVGGKAVSDRWSRLSEKYIGRTSAKRLLSRFRVTKACGEVPAYRVVRCGVGVLDEAKGVGVYRALAAARSHFAGIVQCGSVWHCPVCSAKVASRRWAEMLTATERCVEEGGVVGLLTLTVQHNASDSAVVSLERLKRLNDRLNAGKRAQRFREAFGVIGQIKATEFTIGENGWHPHVHALVFCQAPICWESARHALFQRYADAALTEFGFELSPKALDFRGGEAAAGYVSGWGVEREVAGGAWKHGKGGSFAPFDLLLSYASPDLTRAERHEAGRKFVDFATAVSVLKDGRVTSTQQLVWSRGLKDRFGIADLTDERIAQMQEEPAAWLGQLTFDQWIKVLSVKQYDARLVILQLSSVGSWNDVLKFVSSLPEPTGSVF